jgi:transposase
MLPYPKELRARVVAAVEQGEFSIPEIARLFSVGTTFIKKMLRLHRAGESLAPRRGAREQPLLKEKELAVLKQAMAERPDATLPELAQVLAEKRQVVVSLSTVCRAVQKLSLPRKKKAWPPVSGTKNSAKSFAGSPEHLTCGSLSSWMKWGATILLPGFTGAPRQGSECLTRFPPKPRSKRLDHRGSRPGWSADRVECPRCH